MFFSRNICLLYRVGWATMVSGSDSNWCLSCNRCHRFVVTSTSYATTIFCLLVAKLWLWSESFKHAIVISMLQWIWLHPMISAICFSFVHLNSTILFAWPLINLVLPSLSILTSSYLNDRLNLYFDRYCKWNGCTSR